MKILTAPTGTRLQGTLDLVPCIAQVDPENPMDADGTINYVGGTDMDWDGQTQVERDGEPVWVDEDGTEWKFSQLVWAEQDEDDDD